MFSKVITILAFFLAFLWALLSSVWVKGCVDQGSGGGARSRVERTLNGAEFSGIDVDFDGDWATLEGEVPSVAMKNRIANLVAQQGVRGVTNNLKVTGSDTSELEVLRSMYALAPHHAPFNYSLGADGALTLIGLVPNQATKDKILESANAAQGVTSVIDRLTLMPKRSVEGQIADILTRRHIYFAFNSAKIRRESAPALEAITHVLRQYPHAVVAIEGHTDSVGSEAYNDGLSKRRAAAVRDELVHRGIDGRRLTAQGFGETRPVVSNDSNEGRAKNRRIEFRVAG